ncbi:hypothetical protein K439DRAFT_1343091, partial [Ramaria rubella]
QRDLPVWDYARQIRALLNSIGDISERQLTVYFWNGAQQQIQERWATEKFNPEFSTFSELELAAEAFEMALTIRKTVNSNHRSHEHVSET